MRSGTSLRLHTTSSGEKLLKVSRYFSVVIDTTKKRNCSKTVVSHSQTHTKSGRLSCKFCKPVASFPGLPKFFEGLVPRLHGSRGLASSPGSAQLPIAWKRNCGRGPGIYKIERMVEKIFSCAWVLVSCPDPFRKNREGVW